MRHRPTNNDSYIDARDVARAVEDLEDERAALVDAVESAEDEEAEKEARAALEEFDSSDDAAELKHLSAFLAEIGDARYVSTLVSDDAFADHARQLAEDMGAEIDEWPYTCIDWEQAANELQADYSSAEFDGTTYWFQG